MSPTFFLSYAHDDAAETKKKLLIQFYFDLEGAVATAAGKSKGCPWFGKFDGASIDYGADWDTCLSDALRSDKVCVAVINAAFFSRESCGKELFAFIRRTSAAWVDTEGYIRDLHNILPIRWEHEAHYRENGVRDARIPKIIRKIEDLAGTEDEDKQIRKAIQRYRKHGMQTCVKPNTDRYDFLIRIIADRIMAIPDLPPAVFPVGFDKMPNAFELDWSTLLLCRGFLLDNT